MNYCSDFIEGQPIQDWQPKTPAEMKQYLADLKKIEADRLNKKGICENGKDPDKLSPSDVAGFKTFYRNEIAQRDFAGRNGVIPELDTPVIGFPLKAPAVDLRPKGLASPSESILSTAAETTEFWFSI